VKERQKIPSYFLALSLLTGSCASAEASKVPDNGDRSDFPKGLWRYTGGPHPESKNQLILSAIDIAPEVIINCPLPESMKGESNIGFSAFRGGTVHSIEPGNGITRVKDKDGVIWEYLHIKPRTNLKVRMQIEFGRGLGTLACLFPPGGEIIGGLHVHVSLFLEGKDGKLIPIPIDKRKIGKWTVYKGETEYNGTLMAPGEPVRIADARVCIPSRQNLVPCGRNEKGEIIRNDIPNPFVDIAR